MTYDAINTCVSVMYTWRSYLALIFLGPVTVTLELAALNLVCDHRNHTALALPNHLPVYICICRYVCEEVKDEGKGEGGGLERQVRQ